MNKPLLPTTRFFRSKVLGTVLTVTLFVLAAHCASNEPVTEMSWYAWVTGKTLSVDFHFLDLLELLSR
jgi:hypothetical protein